jgi:23S rRNA pseudouridine2605 synthase
MADVLADAGERVAKRLARAGVASRREVERMIAAGRVAVDGTVLTSLAVNVKPESRVMVDGALISEPAPSRLWRYHSPKPNGLLSRGGGRSAIPEHLPSGLDRAIPIGGLDENAEGLLLLTNDGDLAQMLQERATGWRRQYRVRVLGNVNDDLINRLGPGIEANAQAMGPMHVNLDRRARSSTWLIFNVQSDAGQRIACTLDDFGLRAARSIRLSFGPFLLGDLPRGAVEQVDVNDPRLRL